MVNRLLWPSSKGEDRQKAISHAASHLLSRYRLQYEEMVPVHLPYLAKTLNAEIRRVSGLQCGARLLPTSGGFVILVDDELPAPRYRTAIAHELAHTLFYSSDGKVPQRLLPNSQSEERFCFDVARQLLAPPWLIDAIGVRMLNDSRLIFSTLIQQLCLSRPMASRVMLQDHLLLNGVAGYWIKDDDGWRLRRGNSYSSPTLDLLCKKQLHNTALRWLNQKVHLGVSKRICGTVFSDNKSAFVIVDYPKNTNTLATISVDSKKCTERSYSQLELKFE